jgi:L-aspartate oxidase
VSCTGVHGANRLASNGVLEAVVYGQRIAEDVLGGDLSTAQDGLPTAPPAASVATDRAALSRLRALAYDAIGVVRDAAGLTAAVSQLRAMARSGGGLPSAFDNALLVATMVAACAWLRQESRGSHFRSDFPEFRSGPPERTMTTLTQLNAATERIAAGQRDKRPA